MNGTDEQRQFAVNEIDPDWRDHFHHIEQAVDFYRNEYVYKQALERVIRIDKSEKLRRIHRKNAPYIDQSQPVFNDHNRNWPTLTGTDSARFEKDIER